MRVKIIIVLLFLSCSGASPLIASRLNDVIVQKTLTWNKLITEQNLQDLEKMYPESVIGYGVRSSTAKFMEAKAKFYLWAEGFTQTIVSDFTIKKYKDGQIVCEFVKQSTFKGKTKNFPSYLVFEKLDGEYLITAEGDVFADSYNGFKLQMGAVKSVEVVALNDIRTSNFTVPLVIGLLVLIILGFLVFLYRRNHLKLKNEIARQQIQPDVRETPSPVKVQEVEMASKSFQDIQKEKGDEFEKFIIRSFNQDYFTAIHWTGDKGVDGIYARSNQNPDLIMEFSLNQRAYRFAVECKWRSQLSADNEIQICRSDQLDRYKRYGVMNKMEVFLALGIGGKPEYPEKLFIIPLKYASHPVVKSYFLEKYRKDPGSLFYYDISSRLLK
jgi:hypothetical protein